VLEVTVIEKFFRIKTSSSGFLSELGLDLLHKDLLLCRGWLDRCIRDSCGSSGLGGSLRSNWLRSRHGKVVLLEVPLKVEVSDVLRWVTEESPETLGWLAIVENKLLLVGGIGKAVLLDETGNTLGNLIPGNKCTRCNTEELGELIGNCNGLGDTTWEAIGRTLSLDTATLVAKLLELLGLAIVVLDNLANGVHKTLDNCGLLRKTLEHCLEAIGGGLRLGGISNGGIDNNG
jgi:hypothetical protein